MLSSSSSIFSCIGLREFKKINNTPISSIMIVSQSGRYISQTLKKAKKAKNIMKIPIVTLKDVGQ
jgi:hypothetical protein